MPSTSVSHPRCQGTMTKWMGLEVPFWLIVAVGLGLVLLVILQVRNEEMRRETASCRPWQ